MTKKELRQLIEEQQEQIEELTRRIDSVSIENSTRFSSFRNDIRKHVDNTKSFVRDVEVDVKDNAKEIGKIEDWLAAAGIIYRDLFEVKPKPDESQVREEIANHYNKVMEGMKHFLHLSHLIADRQKIIDGLNAFETAIRTHRREYLIEETDRKENILLDPGNISVTSSKSRMTWRYFDEETQKSIPFASTPPYPYSGSLLIVGKILDSKDYKIRVKRKEGSEEIASFKFYPKKGIFTSGHRERWFLRYYPNERISAEDALHLLRLRYPNETPTIFECVATPVKCDEPCDFCNPDYEPEPELKISIIKGGKGNVKICTKGKWYVLFESDGRIFAKSNGFDTKEEAERLLRLYDKVREGKADYSLDAFYQENTLTHWKIRIYGSNSGLIELIQMGDYGQSAKYCLELIVGKC